MRVIAINNSYELAPWADICYFADARWWEWHKSRPMFRDFAGQKVTIENTGMMVADAEVFMMKNDSATTGIRGLSNKPNALQTGSNSGYQAINLAVLAGAKRVLLLGYDMHFEGVKSHWHNGHPIKLSEDAYRSYARKFDLMVPELRKLGVTVVNCTKGSAIKAFPFADIIEALQ